MMDPNSRVFCPLLLDNITDGLALTDSFSLIQQISAACKKAHLASIITLLQPSDEIIQLFDKLLVLSSKSDGGVLHRTLVLLIVKSCGRFFSKKMATPKRRMQDLLQT